MIWILLACMILAFLLYVMAPLYRARSEHVEAAPDTSDYLSEIVALEARIKAGERGLAARKTDLERRVLASAATSFAPDKGPGRIALGALCAGLAMSAVGLYVGLGRPDLSGPQSEQSEQDATHDMSLESLTATLKARLDANPDQPEGWLLYARSLMRLMRYDEALSAYERAASLTDDSANIIDELSQARAFIAQQSNPSLGIPGPSHADVDAASQMDEDSRAQMINAMVEGLAIRLYEPEQGAPLDAASWVRLLRARQVLGQTAQIDTDITKLKTLHPDQDNAIADILSQSGVTP